MGQLMATTQGSFRELCLGFSVLFFLLVSSIGSLSMFACCWLLLLLLLSLPCPALDRTLFDRNRQRFCHTSVEAELYINHRAGKWAVCALALHPRRAAPPC